MLKMYMWLFEDKKIILQQNYGSFYLDNFDVRLQYRVSSLCNQLLPGFSSNQFETLQRCYKHIEDVHVTLQTIK